MQLSLVVDHACNLRCDYCYAGHKSSRPMTHEMAERAVDFALARDPNDFRLAFFGGEPLTRIDLMEHVADYANRQLRSIAPQCVMRIGMNTNATLVDERVEQFVRTHPTFAYVSLDGPAQIHDRHRRYLSGQGSYAAAREGLRRLSEAGASIEAASVINPDTASLVGEIAEELLNLPVARANVVCNLRAMWNDEAIEALRNGLTHAAAVWKQAFRAGKACHFEPFTSKVLTHLHAAMPCAGRCQLQAEDVVLAPSGRFYTCGEIVGEDLDDALSIGHLDSGIDQHKLARLRAQKEQIEAHCATCDIRERCASSCGCKHVALTGAYGQVTSTLCEIEMAYIDAADAAAEELYAEGCESFLEFFYRRRWVPQSSSRTVQLRRRTELSE